jgi:GNAT superfamily N-acetyltransferase
MTLTIVPIETPSEADREAILAPLRAYNIRHAGDPRIKPVALVLTDDAGRKVGGLWGRCSYDWLFVELLSVPEGQRGGNYGSALMAQAEGIARDHGCVGMWLDTFEFQARGFYEKLGFEVFGTMEDYPVGGRRLFLRKRF